MPKQVIGRKGRSRQIDDTPAVNLWKTDVVEGKDPDFEYQFFNESQVRDKLHATTVRLTDFETGASDVHQVAGWEIVRRDTSQEELAGWRPDEGKPPDNVLRHGTMVCMKLPRKDWEVLQAAQEQRADAYDQRLSGGRSEEYDVNGNQIRATSGRLPGGRIRITEQPLERV
jgi:hypothetical protein